MWCRCTSSQDQISTRLAPCMDVDVAHPLAALQSFCYRPDTLRKMRNNGGPGAAVVVTVRGSSNIA